MTKLRVHVRSNFFLGWFLLFPAVLGITQLLPTSIIGQQDERHDLMRVDDGMPHSHDASMMAEHMAMLDLVPHEEATAVSVNDGAWSDSLTWLNGVVPGEDARVVISEGVHVTYDVFSDVSLFTVRIDGHLEFETQMDTRMVLDTVVVGLPGRLTIGTADNPVVGDVSAEIVIANNGPIDTDWDPMLLSRGVISHGAVEMHGEEKTTHLKVDADPMAGDASITLAEVPENWRTGDMIVIAGTNYEGHIWDNDIRAVRYHEPEDEVRMITAIEGNDVYFNEPLIYDHDTPRADLMASVANYTRSISIKTEDAAIAEVYERGHVMFMHSDDVDIRYVEFHELGRTDKSERSDSASDFNNISFDDNAQGRYSVHIHRTGVEDLDNPAILEGNAVFGSPGWGFVHHDSHAILHGNASYDTFGAGFVAETGNETGSWTNNIAIYAQGLNRLVKDSSDVQAFDLGRTGDGFWFQGRMVESSGNIAASVNNGFVYMHRGDGMLRVASSSFEQAAALGFAEDVSPGDVPILHFRDNETFASERGLLVIKANQNQAHDIHSHLTNFTAWNVRKGAFLEYTSHYILEDFDLVAMERQGFSIPEAGIEFGNNTSDMIIIDPLIDGFEVGVSAKVNPVGDTRGQLDGSNSHYILSGAQITNTQTPTEGFTGSSDRIFETTPETGPFVVDLDGPLTYSEQGDWRTRVVGIDGTKSDAFGTIDLPAGTDNYDASQEEVRHILQNEGYFSGPNGARYFVLEDYYSDRLTGEIHKIGHLVELDPSVNVPDMIYRGEYDFERVAPIATDDESVRPFVYD